MVQISVGSLRICGSVGQVGGMIIEIYRKRERTSKYNTSHYHFFEFSSWSC